MGFKVIVKLTLKLVYTYLLYYIINKIMLLEER